MQTQHEKEIALFGQTINDLKINFESYKTADRALMAAFSLLSDLQESVRIMGSEQNTDRSLFLAKDTIQMINVAKWIIAESVEIMRQ